MDKRQIVKNVASGLSRELRREGTGHDWWHVKRVLDMSTRIARKEKGANMFFVQMTALLHDLDDWKLVGKKNSLSLANAKRVMREAGVENSDQKIILRNIAKISFKGTGLNVPPDLEGKIVQDADRLDALGAVGIARLFAVGGRFGKVIHDPAVKPWNGSSRHPGLKGTSINHFYEKVLKLKNLLNTKTAQQVAVHRHKFVVSYLREFFLEWKGKR